MPGRATRLTAAWSVGALVAVPVLVTGLTGLAGSAASAATPQTSAHQSVTVQLASPRPGALARLAQAHGLTPRQRRAQLATVVPTGGQRARVVAELQARGLTVVHQTPWSITASGTPAAAAVPASALSGVTSVVSSADTTPVVHPLTSPVTGATLQGLYGTTSAQPQSGNPALTVATLQFSGWDRTSLTKFATAHSLPDPVASDQYTEVGVDGTNPRTVITPPGSNQSDDIEVALDQESLLSVAPYVDQRAYFAPNTLAGFVDGVYDVGADAAAYNIAALSISWGDCEQDWGTQAIGVLHQAFQSLLAEGVTVFASSGDSGTRDCATSNVTSVDYPASDPYVIGVGGTTVTSLSPYTESAWPDGGGGSSVVFSRPAYQHAAAPTATRRQVPDIAADADPQTGLVIMYGSQGDTTALVGGTSLASPTSAGLFTDALQADGHTAGIGDIHARLYDDAADFRDITTGSNGYAATVGYDDATGLGAPQWDALVTDLDTAPAVSAPTYSGSRTVPISVNVPSGATYVGWRAGTGAAPACSGLSTGDPVPTAVGATSDGSTQVWVQGLTDTSACYTATTVTFVDTGHPTAHGSLALTSPTSGAHATVSWTAADSASGVKSAVVTVYTVGTTAPLEHLSATGSGSHTFTTAQGHSYVATVTVTDRAGTSTTVTTAHLAVPLDDTHLALHGRWVRQRNSAAYGGSWVASSTRGSTASVSAAGSRFSLIVTTCSTCGRAAVYLDGRRVATLDLYSSSTHHRVVVLVGSRTEGTHRVSVTVLGTRRSASRGTAVDLDGVVALR